MAGRSLRFVVPAYAYACQSWVLLAHWLKPPPWLGVPALGGAGALAGC
jgi:hypothetical protein